METSQEILRQQVIIKDRKSLTIDNVLNILEFTEKGLTLLTGNGAVTVEGEDLKIESLDNESSTAYIVGKIDGVAFKNAPKKQGFFSKLFG